MHTHIRAHTRAHTRAPLRARAHPLSSAILARLQSAARISSIRLSREVDSTRKTSNTQPAKASNIIYDAIASSSISQDSNYRLKVGWHFRNLSVVYVLFSSAVRGATDGFYRRFFSSILLLAPLPLQCFIMFRVGNKFEYDLTSITWCYDLLYLL
jgi:hypothetical protein